MNIHHEVCLIPWDESWERAYHLEKQGIISILLANDWIADIFHVGSTSVKGMISKPIIDILVCPDEDVPLEKFIPALEHLGYKNLGECGRPGRYFLSRGDMPGETFYLHLCHKSHAVAQDQLLFQKLVKTIPEVFQGYYQLKTILEDIFTDDRMMSRELKGIYIAGVLSAYRCGSKVEND